MAEIDKSVCKELKSFELSQLDKLLGTLEENVMYESGMHFINGGYANVTAYEVDDDLILIESEYGEQDMGDGRSSNQKNLCSIDRGTLADKELGWRDKLEAIEWGN